VLNKLLAKAGAQLTLRRLNASLTLTLNKKDRIAVFFIDN
jgi:hypothetical protein